MLNRDGVNLLDKIQEALYKPKYRQQQFIFTGDTSETDFALPRGWKPFLVFGTAGDLKLEGAAEDYTVAVAHDVYTVIFASAPSAANFAIVGEMQ